MRSFSPGSRAPERCAGGYVATGTDTFQRCNNWQGLNRAFLLVVRSEPVSAAVTIKITTTGVVNPMMVSGEGSGLKPRL